MKTIVRTNRYPALIVRLAVGLIFLSEGIQKFIYPEVLGSGRFAKLGIHPPVFWAGITGMFEIVCALLVIGGLYIRLAVLPLLVIIMVAFISTKWPIFNEKGFWSLIHEGRTDFAMFMLLILLFVYGAGNYSADLRNYSGNQNQL
jgi:putative oxidoreductase